MPLARLGQSEEVATLVVFLLGDESSFVTGITVPVDGRFTQKQQRIVRGPVSS